MTENLNPGVAIGIRRIKDISFSMNEELFAGKMGKEMKIEFQQQTNISVSNNLLFFTLRVFYHFADEEEILLDIKVQNIFQVLEFSKYIKNNIQIDFPDAAWVSIVGLSISHTRAILAQRTSGTIFQDSLIPIVNPVDIAKSFFPDNFKEA